MTEAKIWDKFPDESFEVSIDWIDALKEGDGIGSSPPDAVTYSSAAGNLSLAWINNVGTEMFFTLSGGVVRDQYHSVHVLIETDDGEFPSHTVLVKVKPPHR